MITVLKIIYSVYVHSVLSTTKHTILFKPYVTLANMPQVVF